MDRPLFVWSGPGAKQMIEYRIEEDSTGMRLDKYLRKRLPSMPTSHLFKMIRVKKVRVNGKRAQPEQPLASGDVISIRGDEKQLMGPSATGAPRAPPPARRLPGLSCVDVVAAGAPLRVCLALVSPHIAQVVALGDGDNHGHRLPPLHSPSGPRN